MDKVLDWLGGGIFTGIKDGFMSYFPPDATPQQKAEAEYNLQALLSEKQREADKLSFDMQAEFNNRIKELEGTAADLKTIPILGPLVIFLRGVQRPAWGFYTAYLDYIWFTNSDAVTAYSDKQESALILINLLVLGFLFGERVVLNLQPLIIKLFAKK